jgi:hypothetical protein
VISKQLKSGHWCGVSKNSSNSNVLLQISNYDFFQPLCHDQVRIRLIPDEARRVANLLMQYADEVDAKDQSCFISQEE